MGERTPQSGKPVKVEMIDMVSSGSSEPYLSIRGRSDVAGVESNVLSEIKYLNGRFSNSLMNNLIIIISHHITRGNVNQSWQSISLL